MAFFDRSLPMYLETTKYRDVLPDAEDDYYHITDFQYDRHYWSAKFVDILNSLASDGVLPANTE